MGIDTVKLEGKGFEILVTEGQKVKMGEPMMKLDLEFLSANAPSLVSPILDTEPEDNQRIRLLANGEIKAGEPLFAVETLGIINIVLRKLKQTGCKYSQNK